jgi:mono/diheme cytochrome c family protein
VQTPQEFLTTSTAAICRGLTAVICSALFVGGAQAASGPPEAKAIFQKRCTACHTFGKGVKVGPDLKGVNERRKHEWLVAFVQRSSAVLQSGDATATKLFQEFKRERMPDWSDLSREQIDAILAYLAANGPEQKEPDERDASTATAGEIGRGERLFYGGAQLTYGGQACAACHQIQDRNGLQGGTLGPDLTGVYGKYQDKGMTVFLRRPCYFRIPESTQESYLKPEEIFVLKAYLAQGSKLSEPSHLIRASRLAKTGSKGQ